MISENRVFFDNHIHFFNFDHICVSGLLKEVFKFERFWDDLKYFVSLARSSGKTKIVNLCQALENEVSINIKSTWEQLAKFEAFKDYKKVMVPLVLSFEKKSPKERVDLQVEDLKAAIKDVTQDDRIKDNLFIFPFYGVETGKYKNPGPLIDKLTECFNKILTKKTLENGDFIGVKIYPSFGTTIYDNLTEKDEVVTALFDFCLENQIPITTHCSNMSYNLDYKANREGNPSELIKALNKHEKYNDLRFCMAHFGGKIKNSWSRQIAGLIQKNNNFYTDISYIADQAGDMNRLKSLIKKDKAQENKIEDKVLFGSDWFLMLAKTQSYADYLKNALRFLGKNFMHHFASDNVLNFYGKKIVTLFPDELQESLIIPEK